MALLVCNRTGPDRTLNFTKGESVVAKEGRKLLSLPSDQAALFLIEWDLATQTLASTKFQQIIL